MKSVLPSEAITLLSALEYAGYESYVVGGCVRDFLMGKIPHDIDITTSATPDQMKRVFYNNRVIETGIQHGTLSVQSGEKWFEITTFRTDGIYEDHRHPKSVTFTNKIKDDLSRRDFTVNAMAYHPNVGFVDYFGGKEDIAARRIRAVGSPRARFNEDGLRILRGLRFASVLGFSIEQETADAIHDLRDLLKNISNERVYEEMTRLLCGNDADRVLREYVDVFGVVLPELLTTVGFEQNNHFHIYDVFEHTLLALKASSPDPIVRWAVLLHDLGKPATHTRDENGDHFKGHAQRGVELAREILTRLRADRQTIRRVAFLVEYHDTNVFGDEKSIKMLLGKCTHDDAYRLLQLQRADSASHAPSAQNRFGDFFELEKRLTAVIEKNPCVTREQLALSGEDVIALGVARGKSVGKALSRLLDAVLEEQCENTREELADYLTRYLSDL